jgi:HPt (histidine-containing phosphotransfer) domain-containing protein
MRTGDRREQTNAKPEGEVHTLTGRLPALLDSKRLQEVQYIAADENFMSRLIAGFDQDIERLLASLATVLERGDLASVGDITHAIKGAALGIGAARFASYSVELEKMARAGELDATRAALPRLRECFSETSESLHRYPVVFRKAASS